MAYILDTIGMVFHPEEIKNKFEEYYQYIDSVKESLPSGVYEWAITPWHYDPEDPRCPHDAWLESICIKEITTDKDDPQTRHLEIHVRLINGYHNGYIELLYQDVKSYNITKQVDLRWGGTSPNQGHRDWLIDELRLSEHNLVLHEILFDGQTRWIIECKDIKYTWIPLISSA